MRMQWLPGSLLPRESLGTRLKDSVKASHRRRSLLLFVYSDSYYGRARAEVRTNQMGHITVIARVARDLWQRKQTLSSGFALGLGSFTSSYVYVVLYIRDSRVLI